MKTQACPLCSHEVPVAGLSVGTRIPCPACGCVMQVLDDKSIRVHGDFTSGDTVAGSVGNGGAAAALQTAPNPTPSESPIPGYIVLEELGRGGMAVVFKAQQESLDRTVALKIMAQRLAQDPDFVRRFEREAKALAALNHPNITSIYDRGKAGDKIFFVMEFVEGIDLRNVVDQNSGKIPQERALHLMIQVAEALAYVHAAGTIHRDIKPENVLITGDDVVKVTDFGLAAMADPGGKNHNLTGENMMMGTLNYMPPEQRADAKSVDHRADIYSYGVMLYEVLTGTVPLGKWEPASTLVPQLDHRFDDIIGNCLRNNRNERYQSIEFARDALIEIRDGPAQSLELNIPLTGATMESSSPAVERTAPTQARPAAPEKRATVKPTAAPTANYSDPGAAGQNQDLESLVAQAKANMVAQRTRGLPTRVQAFPGLDPPKRRGRLFLLSIVAMLLVVTGGYFAFEGQILTGILVRTKPGKLAKVDSKPYLQLLKRARNFSKSRATTLVEFNPEAFQTSVLNTNLEHAHMALLILSKSHSPKAAQLAGRHLTAENFDLFKTAVEVERRLGTAGEEGSPMRREVLKQLNSVKVNPDPKRATYVTNIIRAIEEGSGNKPPGSGDE